MSFIASCSRLPELLHPLANRFYRSHRTAMRAKAHHQVWALQSESIEACLCMQPMEDGHWLTNLLVDPALRNQGRAETLLAAVRCHVTGPIWLFCNPALVSFYARLGYVESSALPRPLSQKLERYQRTKKLIALCNAPEQGRLHSQTCSGAS